MATPLFTLFPRLPTEIRLQIWRIALEPEPPGPVLFPFKSGCWQPRRLTPADPHFDPVRDELNLTLEFRHELLDEVFFHVPLYSVNQEARSVAWPYIASQNLRRRSSHDDDDDDASCRFARRFDPSRDVLLLPRAEAERALLSESLDRLFEPDLTGRDVDCPWPAVSRLAVTSTAAAPGAGAGDVVAAPDYGALVELCQDLRTVYLVLDPPGGWRSEGGGGRHWEVAGADKPALTFAWQMSDGVTSWSIECSEEEGVVAELVHQIKRRRDGLVDTLVELGVDWFEILGVYAVER
ncbi:hypothetical protein ISF_06823 [Cordyceps fumosorosea ARSEF 2679]|uniref:2EXR domain-containing protein n=1 Tax=Cordyceps fumosorosea (strain ARSEF 2679) TaxID=1081104 RepID=A0A167R5B1_CORFA|nr:hypothetical protein ISF_06823 [Cordyceps fumosorosea ARSEF 2679]OAA58284.1 hypothetical protein ISF_06823 [Cordyceps fumosorosea ARSEF 2679]